MSQELTPGERAKSHERGEHWATDFTFYLLDRLYHHVGRRVEYRRLKKEQHARRKNRKADAQSNFSAGEPSLDKIEFAEDLLV